MKPVLVGSLLCCALIVLHTAVGPHRAELLSADHPELLDQMHVSAAACSAACSPKPLPSLADILVEDTAAKCAAFWTADARVYDLHPPTGVIVGREALLARMVSSLKGQSAPGGGFVDLKTNVTRQFFVRRAGYLDHATTLAWQTGLWKILSPSGQLLSIGRYSSVMRQESGVWKYQILAVVETFTGGDWTLVQNGQGGRMLTAAQSLMSTFADGLNHNDYSEAFSVYTPDAHFPVMSSMGGDDVSFAIKALQVQREKMTSVMFRAHVDEVVFPQVGNDQIAVAHGLVRMLDNPAGLWLFNRFSFLLILVRDTSPSAPADHLDQRAWKIWLDFSPNNWLEPLM